MLELPTAHYFLSVKVGAAHWVTHYVILQSELPMGSPRADIIMSLHKQWAAHVQHMGCLWAAHFLFSYGEIFKNSHYF